MVRDHVPNLLELSSLNVTIHDERLVLVRVGSGTIFGRSSAAQTAINASSRSPGSLVQAGKDSAVIGRV